LLAAGRSTKADGGFIVAFLPHPTREHCSSSAASSD